MRNQCSFCMHEELYGALFCSECGAQLIPMESRSTRAFIPPFFEQPARDCSPSFQPALDPSASDTDLQISLEIVSTGQIIPLTGRNDYTLGRVAEGQPILPDIDLSTLDAYAQGVSRLHALLKIVNHSVSVVDLGSSNGTQLEGEKLEPNRDYPVTNGAVLTLGKMQVRLNITQNGIY